jgi:teichoic acid transport system permease protein
MGTSTSSFEHAVIYGDDEPPPSLARYARELWSRRSLLSYLTRTGLKAQHYDTTFGKAWLVLGPLMKAGVYMLARGVMRPAGDAEHARMVIAHIVMGVFIFQYVAGGITTGASSVLANTRMVLNTSVPCGVFPTTTLMGGVVTLAPTLVVLLAVRAVLRQPFGISLLAVPVVVVLLTGFIYGVSLAMAALTVYFRDTTNFLTYLTRLWLFVTPVIYTVDEIPPNLRRVLAFNPLYPYYAALDDALSAQCPAYRYLAWAAAWTVGALVVGLSVFLAKERHFAVRL